MRTIVINIVNQVEIYSKVITLQGKIDLMRWRRRYSNSSRQQQQEKRRSYKPVSRMIEKNTHETEEITTV